MPKYTETLRRRADILGNRKIGHCTICGAHGLLTADHVPPKGCIAVKDVYFNTLSLAGVDDARGPVIQGGIKFKTLCGNCNSNLLGQRYDPALAAVVQELIGKIRAAPQQAALRPRFEISYQPNLVARAVVGHLLAAHSVSETAHPRESLGASESLRKFFLNPDLPFPADWRLFCWPFLSRNQVILRHITMAELGNVDHILYGHIIKFFPVGFWLVNIPPEEKRINAIEITPESGKDLHYASKIVYDLLFAPHPQFPENPEGNWMVLSSDTQTSVATPRG